MPLWKQYPQKRGFPNWSCVTCTAGNKFNPFSIHHQAFLTRLCPHWVGFFSWTNWQRLSLRWSHLMMEWPDLVYQSLLLSLVKSHIFDATRYVGNIEIACLLLFIYYVIDPVSVASSLVWFDWNVSHWGPSEIVLLLVARWRRKGTRATLATQHLESVLGGPLVGGWVAGAVLIPPTKLTTCRGRLNCLCNYYYYGTAVLPLNCLCNYYYGTASTTATELLTAVCKYYHWTVCKRRSCCCLCNYYYLWAVYETTTTKNYLWTMCNFYHYCAACVYANVEAAATHCY